MGNTFPIVHCQEVREDEYYGYKHYWQNKDEEITDEMDELIDNLPMLMKLGHKELDGKIFTVTKPCVHCVINDDLRRRVREIGKEHGYSDGIITSNPKRFYRSGEYQVSYLIEDKK